MASFGGFAGGMAQSINQWMPMLGKQDEDALRQKQFEEQMRQKKLEENAAWVKQRQEGYKNVLAADPEKAPLYMQSVLKEWEEREGTKVPSMLRALFDNDPDEAFETLSAMPPEMTQQAVGSNKAFNEFFPMALQAKAARKAQVTEQASNAAVQGEAALLEGAEKQAVEKGIPKVFGQLWAATQARQNLVAANPNDARIGGFDKRIEALQNTAMKLSNDPSVMKALLSAGQDPTSAFQMGVPFQQATAAQGAREALQAGSVEEEKAFGQKAGASRFDLSPQGLQQGRFDVEKAGATTKAQEIGRFEAQTSPAGTLALDTAKTRELVGKSFESGLTFAREHSKMGQIAMEQRNKAIALSNALKITGPGGAIKGSMKAAISKALGGFFPGVDVAAYETIDSLILALAKEDLRLMAPVTGTDVKIELASQPNYKMTEQARQELVDLILARANRGFDLANRATAYLGAVQSNQTKEGYDSVYNKYLSDWGEAGPGAGVGLGGQGTKPGGGAGSAPTPPRGGGGTPPATGGISSLPPELKDDVAQIRFAVAQLPPESRNRALAVAQIESGFRTNPVHLRPDGKPQLDVKGAWGLKQSTMENPGFPGVRPLKGEEQSDVVKQAIFSNQYLAALTTHYGSQRLGLAAYNAGPGTIDAYFEGKGGKDAKIKERAEAGFQYADKVLSAMSGENPTGDVKGKRQSVVKNVARAAVELATTFGMGKVVGGAAEVAGRAAGLGEAALSRSVAGSTLLGETTGAFAGSKLAGAFDEVPDADRQATIAAGLTAASGPFGALIGRMVGPKGLSENGKALVNALQKAGEPNLILPGSAVESRFVRTLQNIGDEASFTNIITTRKDAINQVLGKSGDAYASDMIAAKAKATTFYGLVDDLMGNQKINMYYPKNLMRATMKLADEGKYILQPETRKWFNTIIEGKDTMTTLEVDNLRKVIFDEWRHAFNQGEFGRATAQSRQLADLAHYFDDVVDEAMRKHPVEYQYYKQARAASLQGLQGDAIADLLAKAAKNSPDGTIDGKALLRYLPDYRNGAVKLTPEQGDFLKELGKALVANQEKPSTFRIIARQAEFGGLVGIATGAGTYAATGDPETAFGTGAAAGAALMLAPSGIAKLMASETGRKLFMKAWHASVNGPNTEAAFRAGSQLSAFLAQNAILLE